MVKVKENTGKAKRPLIVMKFGGTSVGSPERMQGVAEILEEHSRHADVVAVVSAMGGATNMLIRAAGETIALKGRDEIAVEPGDQILVATPGGGGYGTRTSRERPV